MPTKAVRDGGVDAARARADIVSDSDDAPAAAAASAAENSAFEPALDSTQSKCSPPSSTSGFADGNFGRERRFLSTMNGGVTAPDTG